MKTTKILWPLLAFYMLVGVTMLGQENPEPPVYRIETTEGNIIVGTIVSETETEIIVNTESLGTITLSKDKIAKKELLTEIDRQFGLSNPNRYFVMNNHLGMPKGKGYYQNTWIFFNQINYGFSNNFSVGAGLVPLFLFGQSTPLWVVPSVSFPVVKDNFSLGANLVFIFVPGESGSAGFLTFGGTLGNRHNNLSLNLGYGFAGGEWASSPLITVSGMVRTGRKHHLLAENYFVNAWDETFILSLLGGRYNFGSLSLDYGLAIPWEVVFEDGFIGFPWLSISIPVGKK
jgi:hypothetical protein